MSITLCILLAIFLVSTHLIAYFDGKVRGMQEVSDRVFPAWEASQKEIFVKWGESIERMGKR